MSQPTHPVPDPHADPLVASVLRADARAAAGACPDAELLAMYAERELGGHEHAQVETHVHGCARCQAIVAALVRALPDEAAVGAAGVTEATAGAGFSAWFGGWRWLVPAASMTAVAVVAVWVGRGPAEETAESSRVAREAESRDYFVRPPATPPGDATAASPDRRALERAMPRRDAPAVSPAPEVRRDGAPAATAPAAALEARQAVVGAAPPAEPGRGGVERQTNAAETAKAEGRTETSGLVGSSAALAGDAASGARVASGEERAAGNAAARLRESAPAAAAPPPLAAPAALAPAAPARATDPVFRAGIAASSWRVRRGVVERSQDGLAWQRVVAPAGVTITAVASVSADVCWAIATDAVFVVTDGVAWTRTTQPPAGPLTNVSATSARAATVTAGGTRFATTDGGATWAPVQ